MPSLPFRLLAISGSLRSQSSNTSLLKAAALLAPEGVEVYLYAGLGELPHFNPDLDAEGSVAPPAVAALRALVAGADGLLISSPEYAHGVPGSLKNALDWLVSDARVAGKPVALLGASTHASFAQASLLETLTVMSTAVIREASVALPLLGRKLDEQGIASDTELAAALRGALSAFVAAIPATAAGASGN